MRGANKVTWSEYASEFKQCFVKMVDGHTQATRLEACQAFTEWVVFLPSPHGTVSCKTIDEARDAAKLFGCTILL